MWLLNLELLGGMCWWICLLIYFFFVVFDIINRIFKGLLFLWKFLFRLENCLRVDGCGFFLIVFIFFKKEYLGKFLNLKEKINVFFFFYI